MKFVLFCHSFVSCWNHGNAHFLRGIARQLVLQRHEVEVYEPADGWSRMNLLRDHGVPAIEEGTRVVPGVAIRTYFLPSLDLDHALESADVVLVHEWTDPELVVKLGQRRIRNGRFLLFFHDTHHRALTAPHEIERFDLDGYDAVLAFGEALREMYARNGWGRRVFTWHEAADAPLFRMNPSVQPDTDLVWIGNWGDGERDEELRRFLLEPVRRLDISARIHGVRYPESIQERLRAHGVHYAGWLANHRVPDAFARASVTVHIPRRPYVEKLPGIPTIRMFEAFACGIPLVSAPWRDVEGLFPPGAYLTAGNSEEMRAALALLLRDKELAMQLARTGLHSIRTRHSCRHRVEQLDGIIKLLHAAPTAEPKLASQLEKMVLQ